MDDVNMKAARGTACVLAEDDAWRPGDKAVRNMAMALRATLCEVDDLRARLAEAVAMHDAAKEESVIRGARAQKAERALRAVTRERDEATERYDALCVEIAQAHAGNATNLAVHGAGILRGEELLAAMRERYARAASSKERSPRCVECGETKLHALTCAAGGPLEVAATPKGVKQ